MDKLNNDLKSALPSKKSNAHINLYKNIFEETSKGLKLELEELDKLSLKRVDQGFFKIEEGYEQFFNIH